MLWCPACARYVPPSGYAAQPCPRCGKPLPGAARAAGRPEAAPNPIPRASSGAPGTTPGPDRPVAPTTAPAQPPPPAGAPPNHPGAVGSLVAGVLSFLTIVGGVLLAPLALLLGYAARRRIDASEGRTGGGSLASVGIILGWVWTGLATMGLVVAAAVMLLAGDLVADAVAGGETESFSGSAELDAGGWVTHGFRLTEPMEVSYVVRSTATVHAAIARVQDYEDPVLSGSERWAERIDTDILAATYLTDGDYGIHLECIQACSVEYEVRIGHDPVSCGTGLDDDPGALHLPAWRPDDAPPGDHLVLEPVGAHPVVPGPETHADGFRVTASDTALHVSTDGGWFGRFEWPAACGHLVEGAYGDLVGDGERDFTQGAFGWAGQGTACRDAYGSVVVDEATYDGAGLASAALRMEVHCGSEPALLVSVSWSRA